MEIKMTVHKIHQRPFSQMVNLVGKKLRQAHPEAQAKIYRRTAETFLSLKAIEYSKNKTKMYLTYEISRRKTELRGEGYDVVQREAT